jgi:ferritin-like protein
MLMDAAVQEMGHLVAVWNITSALGASPRIGRANFLLDPGYLPAGITVKLAPFGPDTLQHCIFLERPHGSTEMEGSGFACE